MWSSAMSPWLVVSLVSTVCWVWSCAAVEMDEDMAALARMVRDECVTQTGVDLALVEAVNAGAALQPDAALKCYVHCTMETAGMLAGDDVDVEAVLAMLPSDFAATNAAALRACGTRRGADACDTAYLTQLCWQNANKKDYFLI